jgi:hypothetical protein
MRFLLPGVLLGLFVTAPVHAQDARVPPLQRVIDANFRVSLPVHFCAAPSTVLGLAKYFEFPAGAEFIPGACHWEREGPGKDHVFLQGMTVEEALNKLVELDGRYRWVESEGVIVMRPLDAWADPKNFLNQVTTGFDLEDKNLGGALDAIVSGLVEKPRTGGDALSNRTELGARTFTVHLGATSVIGALNSVVREHGKMWWEVHDRDEVHEGGLDRMMWLYTPDGSGAGQSTKRYPLGR